MSVELPKDAEGREVPLDTKTLYDEYGRPMKVSAFSYSPEFKKWLVQGWFNAAEMETSPSKCYLTAPDSWEKLEEDLGRAAERDAVVSCCRYFTADKCADCPICGNTSGCLHKEELAFGDILNRIRKLRG